MWGLLFFLWIIPLTLGAFLVFRSAGGEPVLNKNERELFFDERKRTHVDLWLAIKLAVLVVIFFLAGLVQGIILPNLSGFWFVTGPLLTGSAAILLAAMWLRSAAPPRRSRRSRGKRLVPDLRDYFIGGMGEKPRKQVR